MERQNGFSKNRLATDSITTIFQPTWELFNFRHSREDLRETCQQLSRCTCEWIGTFGFTDIRHRKQISVMRYHPGNISGIQSWHSIRAYRKLHPGLIYAGYYVSRSLISEDREIVKLFSIQPVSISRLNPSARPLCNIVANHRAARGNPKSI